MLEDDYTDVIRKARVGLGLSEEQLIGKVGISEGLWQGFLAGNFDAGLARAVASALKLQPEALANHPVHQARPLRVEGIRRLELPFGRWTVNAWWIEAAGVRLVVDAGTGPDDLIEALPALPDAALITHGHHDHVGGIESLRASKVPILTPESLKPGQAMSFGTLRLRTCDLSGHFSPALGYHVEGLEVPVLVVGDALFAGSMGKTSGPETYRQQLDTLHAALDAMPDETLLLPGHGPATTVGEEKRGNPFLGWS